MLLFAIIVQISVSEMFVNVCTVGSTELLELKKTGDDTYSVVYLPTMDGCHLLTVKFTSEETFNR